MEDKELIKRIADEAADTVDMFSDHRKGEKERRVVAAFLRGLGVSFSPDDLVNPKEDPPDVTFKTARFEVTDRHDEDRKIHGEYKEKEKKRRNAEKLEDLMEPYKSSHPMSIDEALPFVIKALEKKANHYDKATLGSLDVLVYLNLKDKHLIPSEINMNLSELKRQGWRSASFLFSACSCVLVAEPDAPDFIRSNKGKIKCECNDPSTLFEI